MSIPQPAEASSAVVRSLLLTDLVDSTKLIRRMGDARAFEVGSRHDRVARDLLRRFDGLEIDKTDGFLLLFENPTDAVGYALAYHESLTGLSMELGVQLRARAGIHVGEVLLRENEPEDVARGAKPLEVEGLAKPTAARVMSMARGNQTLLTSDAFDQARRSADRGELSGETLRWLAHGPYLMKGLEDPLEIFEVGRMGFAPLAAPADSDKVRRSVAAGDEITLGWRPGAGLEIPRRPGWKLVQRLGEGGFGEVWEAERKGTGEKRVFKFCFEAERLQALQREVTLFRLLKETLGDRDDILRILDWNFDESPFFMETEFTEGVDLVNWVVAQGGFDRIDLASRLDLIAQVAEALGAAHSVGVLHKDIKPQNVLILTDAQGAARARIIDFGIGQVTDQKMLLARGLTIMTEIVSLEESLSLGTRLYQAPELIEGKAASVQADIYALGVMLYQFVAGDFSRAMAPGWRRDLADKLLAEDIACFVDGAPERRPASAAEVAVRLRGLERRRAKREEERRAREEARSARLALERSLRRRRLAATVAAFAVAVLAVVSVLAILAVKARRLAERQTLLSESRRLAAQAQLRMEGQLDLALLLSLEAHRTADTFEARSSLVGGLGFSPRLRTLLTGHDGVVASLAFSPVAGLLASGSTDRSIILWDVATRRPVGPPLTGHGHDIWSVAFSPDGRLLASGSNDATLRLWDVASRRPVGQPLGGHSGPVWSVAFSPDGRTLASGSDDETVRLWDVSTGTPRGQPMEGRDGPVWSVAFSPDGRILASGSDGSSIRLWDPSTGEPRRLLGHQAGATCVAFSPDGRSLVAASEDLILVWDLASGELRIPPLLGHDEAIWGLAISPDGRILASSSNDNTLRLWDTSTGDSIGSPLLGHGDNLTKVAFSPDGSTLASGSYDKKILLWDVTESQALGRWTGHEGGVTSVAFSPDGHVLASGASDHSVRLWDVSTGRLRGVPLDGHAAAVQSVAFDPGGETVAAGSYDKTLSLWDTASGELRARLLGGHEGPVESVAFSPDGGILASGSFDRTIGLWDVATGELRTRLTGLDDAVRSVAFSPDGKILAAGSFSRSIGFWDLASGHPLGPLLKEPGSGGAADSSLQWHQVTGLPVSGGEGEVALAYSPDGRTLASGIEQDVVLWDVPSRQIRLRLSGHEGLVTAVAYSPDGRMVASGGRDESILLWDAATGEPVVQLTGHGKEVGSVAFSPDGKTLASGSTDQSILLRDISGFESWRERACEKANRNLNAAEWRRFFGTAIPYRKTCRDLPPGSGAPGYQEPLGR